MGTEPQRFIHGGPSLLPRIYSAHAGPSNLGILAHVDAGKTSLTDGAPLFDTAASAGSGSVDTGSTQKPTPTS